MNTTPFPTKNELLEYFKSLTPEQLAQLDELLLSSSEPWLPQPGPQTAAYYSQADELLFGGAAGGGKTDLLIGVAATAHHRSIIFRREHKQTKGVEERLLELLVDCVPPRGRYNRSDYEFWSHERGGYKIELGGVKDPGDEKKWHGRPHDAKLFDEVTDFTLFQYTYLNIWKRTTRPGQRTRTIAASNPPTDEDGMWVIDYWAPWVSKTYLGVRAMPGELRHFITDEKTGRHIEVEAAARVKYQGRWYEPKSRTFIPSKVSDNLFYAGTAYESQLALLPPELRDKFLGGDFMAGVKADPMQLVPREWVEAAQARWRQRPVPQQPKDQLGVDVSRGGKDEMIVTPKTGNYVHTQILIPAQVSKNGITAAHEVAKYMDERTRAAVDVGGIGTSCYDHLSAIRGGRVWAMNGAERAGDQRDSSGLLGFVNARALWHWRVRELLDPANGYDLALPDDPELLKEACAIRWELTSRGVKVEDKDEVKKRIHRSPDRWDSLVYACNEPPTPGSGLLGFYGEAAAEKAASRRDDKDPPGVLRIGSK